MPRRARGGDPRGFGMRGGERMGGWRGKRRGACLCGGSACISVFLVDAVGVGAFVP